MKKALLLIIFYGVTFIGFSQQSDFKHINFKKSDSIANLYKNANLRNLPLLSYKLTYRLDTDVEKFRAIYSWVCHNITSDYKLTSKILRKGKNLRNDREAFLAWNLEFRAKFLDRLIKDKRTMCTGYAFLIKELCSLANIEAKIINGYGKTVNFNPKKLYPNHSWTSVKLNNKWYLCDAILASGYYFIDIGTFIYDYNDGYFLTDPNLFVKSHYPEDKKWLLTNNSNNTIEEFIAAPFIYGTTYKHKITPVLPNTLEMEVSANKKIPFEFYIDTNLDIKQLSLIQNNGWKESEIHLEDYTFHKGILKFNHQFLKKGLYDVHIKIENDIVVSYTINVKDDLI